MMNVEDLAYLIRHHANLYPDLKKKMTDEQTVVT